MFVGIAGGTGADKATVARRIADGVDDVRLLPLDDYYRDRSSLTPEGRSRVN